MLGGEALMTPLDPFREALRKLHLLYDDAQVREDTGRLEAYKEKALAETRPKRDTAPRKVQKRWVRQFRKS